MGIELFFHAVLAFTGLLLAAIRLYYRHARRAGKTVRNRASTISSLLLVSTGSLAALVTLPHLAELGGHSLPTTARWLGVVLAAITVGLFAWARRNTR